MTFEVFQQHLQDLQRRHTSRRSTRWFGRLASVIEHLRAFSTAISVFTQSNPEITCLVWGTLKIILDAACVVSETLEMVVDMYDKITRAMPRFYEYMELFPRREGLQDALFRIYCAYLDFSMSTVKFLNLHVFLSFVRLGFLQTAFKGAVSQIRDASKEFDDETKLAHTASTIENFSVLKGALRQPSLLLERSSTVFSVPWQKNAKFCGRQSELAQLRKSLIPSSSTQKSCVLHGMAGIGKSQTALQFVYLSRNDFSHIFWLPAEDETVFTEAFGKVSGLLNLVDPSTQNVDLARRVELVRIWLCQNTSWLMIFDNAEASNLLNKYWPACDHGSILITTQDRKMTHRSLSEVELLALGEEDASDLFLRHLPKDLGLREERKKYSRDILKEVRGVPLLLVGLAGYMADSQASFSDTLQEMRDAWSRSDSIIIGLNPDSATFQYQLPIHMAFDVSVSRLPPVALSVLYIMSMLSPDSIHEGLVAVDLPDERLGFLGFQGQARFRREVRSHLVTRHLVEVHQPENAAPFYSLHRQLQWKLLQDQDRDPLVRQVTFDRTVALIRREFPRLSEFMIPMFSEWGSYQQSIAHVLRLQEIYEASRSKTRPISGGLDFAELLASAGNYLYEVRIEGPGLAVLTTSAEICGELRSALQGGKDALDGSSTSTATDSAAALASLVKLEATALTISWGIVSNNHGLSGGRKAMELITRVLHLRQEHVKMVVAPAPDEGFYSRILLSNAYNDNACQLIHMHKHDEAESLLEKSLALKDELSLERDIPAFEYAESKNNLAFVRMGQNRVEEAVTVNEEAVRLIKEEDGHANDHTRFIFCHGVCLVNAGRMEEGLEILREVYKVRVATFGRSNSLTLDSTFAVALVLHRLGRSEEASDAVADCFFDQGTTLWPRECRARATYLRSVILRSLGEEEKADELGASSIAELRSLLSESSPHIPQDSDDLVASHPFLLFDYIPAVPDGDLLLHAGDLTNTGSFEELQAQIDWLKSLPHEHKVVIAGNHDLLLDPAYVDRFPDRIYEGDGTSRSDLDWGGVIYLNDSSARLQFRNGRSLTVYGSPWTPLCGSFAFQYPDVRTVWPNKIPPDTEVLLTHGPPRGHLDEGGKGCPQLLREIWRARPRLVVFGHIHPGHGTEHLEYNGVLRAYDGVMAGDKGLLAVFLMACQLVGGWLWSALTLRQTKRRGTLGGTTLVNAAAVGGRMNEVQQPAIVVSI
ncbi:uncharacterized protein DNG_04980 [Cephalotrichum gorgonifer]|uniref:Calcineurin-like phosphoesterase domain-containing protein n=1 Tax=Cephalotrichum gorgonifer TaxID=2041049 RepID=A0AAE8N024_9PEZI|nr:uncharacterized protein DNG_04980 [Cephalotrichum gorgonifer]